MLPAYPTDPAITVAELIALLQKHDPNAPVVVRDADTEWLLPLYASGVVLGRDADEPRGLGSVQITATYY